MVLDCCKQQIMINSDTLHMSYVKSKELPKVSRVTVPNKTVLPPNSAVHINDKLAEKLPRSCIIEPHEDIPVLMPRCMYSEHTTPRLCLVNASDIYFTIRKGTVIGEAVEAQPLELAVDSKPATTFSKIPDYLKPFLQKSVVNFSECQQEQLENFVTEYQDVFAENDFDPGNFSEIEHSIDTGTATPVKQRMRRTPLDFVQEEESHLQTMLKAGIFEPSSSEWASPTVLIRKRDGKVRWCIDYRKLNSVTKKMSTQYHLLKNV